jgi:hypothetical protein
MNRSRRIASVLILAGLLCMSVSAPVLATGPLLSGYGGPGAGEQAILGATLLGRRGGGSGSGHSTSSQGSNGAASGGYGGSAAGGSTRSTSSSTGGTASGESSAGSAGSGSDRSGSSGGSGGSGRTRESAGRGATHGSGAVVSEPATHAYVYPTSLHLASADSSAFSISSGAALLMILTVALLALVGVLTVRVSRLQR